MHIDEPIFVDTRKIGPKIPEPIHKDDPIFVDKQRIVPKTPEPFDFMKLYLTKSKIQEEAIQILQDKLDHYIDIIDKLVSKSHNLPKIDDDDQSNTDPSSKSEDTSSETTEPNPVMNRRQRPVIKIPSKESIV